METLSSLMDFFMGINGWLMGYPHKEILTRLLICSAWKCRWFETPLLSCDVTVISVECSSSGILHCALTYISCATPRCHHSTQSPECWRGNIRDIYNTPMENAGILRRNFRDADNNFTVEIRFLCQKSFRFIVILILFLTKDHGVSSPSSSPSPSPSQCHHQNHHHLHHHRRRHHHHRHHHHHHCHCQYYHVSIIIDIIIIITLS